MRPGELNRAIEEWRSLAVCSDRQLAEQRCVHADDVARMDAESVVRSAAADFTSPSIEARSRTHTTADDGVSHLSGPDDPCAVSDRPARSQGRVSPAELDGSDARLLSTVRQSADLAYGRRSGNRSTQEPQTWTSSAIRSQTEIQQQKQRSMHNKQLDSIVALNRDRRPTRRYNFLNR